MQIAEEDEAFSSLSILLLRCLSACHSRQKETNFEQKETTCVCSFSDLLHFHPFPFNLQSIFANELLCRYDYFRDDQYRYTRDIPSSTSFATHLRNLGGFEIYSLLIGDQEIRATWHGQLRYLISISPSPPLL